MTSGIGNPDWQRRYAFSAVPILSLTYNDNVNANSPLTDGNGFQYFLTTITMGSSTVFARVQFLWYQDANATQFLGTTDFVVGPNQFVVIKVPAMTRYFKLAVGNVGGTTGHTIGALIYGTNADQEDLLTQNTDVPLGSINATLGAHAAQTVTLPGMYAGRAMITANHSGNNLYTVWLEYYDWSTQTWIIYYNIHGTDHGMAFTEQVWLPYTPVRLNMRNDDTVAQVSQAYLITANTP